MSPQVTERGSRAATGKLLAEFGVIVVGVLVALAVDAAWQQREEDSRLETYLAQLESDLQATSIELDEAIADDSLVRRNATLLQQALNARPLPEPDSLDSFLTGTFQPALFSPKAGTLHAIVQSGDLRLVSDDILRSAILDYMSAIDGFALLWAGYHMAQLEAFGRLGDHVNLVTEVGARRTRTPSWEALSQRADLTSDIGVMRVSTSIRLGLLREVHEKHTALLEALVNR